MKRLLSISLVLAAVSVVAIGSAGAQPAPHQRVAISIAPLRSGDTFALTPLAPGRLEPDAGRVTWRTVSQRVLFRSGEKIRRWIGSGRFEGSRGALVIELRVDWHDAGNGHEAGSGSWAVRRGTRAYAGVAGGGTSSHVWVPRGPASARIYGSLRSRRP